MFHSLPSSGIPGLRESVPVVRVKGKMPLHLINSTSAARAVIRITETMSKKNLEVILPLPLLQTLISVYKEFTEISGNDREKILMVEVIVNKFLLSF